MTKEQLAELEQQREALLLKLLFVENRLASSRCPFNRGDIVTGSIYHKQQYQIDLIIFESGGLGYRIRGVLLKKNGQPSKRKMDLWNIEELKKVTDEDLDP